MFLPPGESGSIRRKDRNDHGKDQCKKYNAYIKILEEELRPAMGCTEPIALAYALLWPERCWENCRIRW